MAAQGRLLIKYKEKVVRENLVEHSKGMQQLLKLKFINSKFFH